MWGGLPSRRSSGSLTAPDSGKAGYRRSNRRPGSLGGSPSCHALTGHSHYIHVQVARRLCPSLRVVQGSWAPSPTALSRRWRAGSGQLTPGPAGPSCGRPRPTSAGRCQQESVNAGRDQATKGASADPRFSRTAAFKRRLNLDARVSPPSVPYHGLVLISKPSLLECKGPSRTARAGPSRGGLGSVISTKDC